jgi:bifunctional DNA-binding transcriptional regulator/antitoxin component of YhaV-PrlF toxin-antitoxin module
MSEKQTFQVLLEKDENLDATRITIPFDAEKVFGAKRVPIKISINGADYRTTIFRMGGKYYVAVPKRFRAAAGVNGGEMITVEIERDTEIRMIVPPKDLAEALTENNEAKQIWEELSYTHRREFVTAIEDAKRAETRQRRVRKTIDELLKKKK